MLKRLLIILSILALGLLLYSVFVENIFAPQSSGGAVMLEPFISDLSYEETALPTGGSDDAETALE